MVGNLYSRDPWKKEIPWCCTRKGSYTIIYIFILMSMICYIVDELVSHNDDFNTNSEFSDTLANAMNLTSNSTVINNTTVEPNNANSTSDISYISSETERVILFISFKLLALLCIIMVLTLSRRFHEFVYSQALVSHCLISSALSSELQLTKYRYRQKNPRKWKSGIISKEEFGIHKVTKRYIRSNTWISRELGGTFQDFMFAFLNRVDEYFFFIDAILWIHDLLMAVDYMHKINVYHLDLQPSSVRLHWYEYNIRSYQARWLCGAGVADKNSVRANLMRVWSHCGEATDAKVVLSKMTHAVRSPNGIVSSSGVGFSDFYKPPECLTRMEVNGRKVDSWGIGIIAIELLTGGMLTIRAKSGDPPTATADSIIRRYLNKPFLSSALDANFKLVANFINIRYVNKKFKTYDLDQTEFVSDVYTFIKGLLKRDPRVRFSVQDALNTSLMKKVCNRKERMFFVNYTTQSS